MRNELYCMRLRQRLALIEMRLVGTLLQCRVSEAHGTQTANEAGEASLQLSACRRVREMVAVSEEISNRFRVEGGRA